MTKVFSGSGRASHSFGAAMFDNYRDLLDMAEVQEVLGVGRSMAYRLVNDGTIKHIRFGKTIRVPKEFLVDYIKSSCYTGDVAVNLSSSKEVKK